MEKRNTLEQLNVNLDGIQDQNTRETIQSLFNIIEEQAVIIRQQQAEIQRLRDEVSRLKGEQGKPDIKPNTNGDANNKDISSEKERKRNTRKHKRGIRNDIIHIDRTELCEADKTTLPDDAVFQGYETVTVQDIKIETDNVKFLVEIYYSLSEGKTYRGHVPAGYEGGFGSRVKSLVIIMKNVCNMSERKILEFFQNMNILISVGTISNILIKNKEQFHQEKQDIFEAGLSSTRYQHTDDTSARVNGQNYHTHIVCNPLYTIYQTTQKKDRLTIIELLQNGAPLHYCLNEEAIHISKLLSVPQRHIAVLQTLLQEKSYTYETLCAFLNEHLPSLKPYARTKIIEATAIAAYHKATGYPVVEVLIADDAPQFKLITKNVALCWIHDGRLYKKLMPVIAHHIKELDAFLDKYWQYYHTLLDYKTVPSAQAAQQLSEDFDRLFSTTTGYDALDERIAKTKQKKTSLLLVLKYPELPLHNNSAELAARVQARKRDVSLHTMTPEGTKANDTFLSIVQTCKKLRVNAYDYIFDRISRAYSLPSLAQLILQQKIDPLTIPANTVSSFTTEF